MDKAMSKSAAANSISGVGIGLRSPHYEYIKLKRPTVPWFEVLIDNYLGRGGQIQQHLIDVCEHYPITFHGVGMSLGSTDPLDMRYLALLKQMMTDYQPVQLSDHLCWTGLHDQYSHDLLPMPYTKEAARHLATRIEQVQDYLGQRILVENVSSYLQYRQSEMSEAEFVASICELADCDLLLDINNVYVSAFNHGFDSIAYINTMPAKRIKEIHLAGYEDQGHYLLDTHGHQVYQPVWDLYTHAMNTFGAIPTLIEWDTKIPNFPVLQQEARQAELIMQKVACHAA